MNQAIHSGAKAPRFAAIVVGVAVWGGAASGAGAAQQEPAPTSKAPAAPASKIAFRAYEVADRQWGGLPVSRFAVPQDWKAASRVVWNFNDFYTPVQVQVRAEAPDGSAWMEFFPAQFFVWIYPPPQFRPRSLGGINHPNITLPEAMVRYIIAPNRGRSGNLRILGYRPVSDLPKAFPHLAGARGGDGICMCVRYEIAGSPVDEEFYGFMPPVDGVPGGRMTEYHRSLMPVHSMGAKAAKLESVRPLLGFIATSVDPNPAWQQVLAQVKQAQTNVYNRAMAQGYQSIEVAKQIGGQVHGSNEAFLQRTDAGLAQGRAQQSAARSSFGAASDEDFYKRSDSFDQIVRGTEHMQDQYGAVPDQYTDYNYHWTDGFGRFVHTDDPNLDRTVGGETVRSRRHLQDRYCLTIPGQAQLLETEWADRTGAGGPSSCGANRRARPGQSATSLQGL